MTNSIIEVRDLHVTLGAAHILRGINFDVDNGTTLAILGPNGSGKSTLVRALVNAIPHSQGNIRLIGADLGRSRKVSWKDIGYAPQRITAAAGVPATALETVESGLVYGGSLRLPKDSKARALAALELVGLAQRAKESVQTFSGGQQQRVLIARALVKNPKILFLDEPFAGIDKESRESIISTLYQLKDDGVTLVLVLHELYGLEDLIDESIMLEHGRIVAQGVPETFVGRAEHGHPAHDHQHPHENNKPSFRAPELGGQLP
ncbi:zinc transport system ATP-binding protein [Arcanobacterium pluranimalium]|uniref:metal ABC transporter ATP-binding protein n=1 Tax=Arcanobacterium pluranimalium TaxID=108028 RepID=UPI00195893DE|nr:ATP-binding cassette domain-containing protein [Arcanobacterium pluranimalium]MBM7825579.1 zinc transport system ATP-binding protein [Arcanobacterium pluranimalium]